MADDDSLATAEMRFDLPPQFAVLERRMADRALQKWQLLADGLVDGFADNQIIVIDPFGAAVVETVATAIIRTFAVAPGRPLAQQDGLAAEVHAACTLVALHRTPLPFEASLPGRGGSVLLVRGIALPIIGQRPERLQAIINWRETLNRSVKARLQRELNASLRENRPLATKADPFDPRNDKRPAP